MQVGKHYTLFYENNLLYIICYPVRLLGIDSLCISRRIYHACVDSSFSLILVAGNHSDFKEKSCAHKQIVLQTVTFIFVYRDR
jgi:hypothetical protein